MRGSSGCEILILERRPRRNCRLLRGRWLGRLRWWWWRLWRMCRNRRYSVVWRVRWQRWWPIRWHYHRRWWSYALFFMTLSDEARVIAAHAKHLSTNRYDGYSVVWLLLICVGISLFLTFYHENALLFIFQCT